MKRKNKFINLCVSVLICVLFVFVLSLSVHAQSIDDIHIIKISPQDERAIIKIPDGKMQIIKVGDVLQVQSSKFKVQSAENKKVQSPEIEMKSELRPKTTELKVVEITKGRVVVEEETDKGVETVIIRLEDEKDSAEFKVQSSEVKKQKIERLKKTEEKQPLLYAPK